MVDSKKRMNVLDVQVVIVAVASLALVFAFGLALNASAATVCTSQYEYTTTVVSTARWDAQGNPTGTTVSCASPGSGWGLADSECLITTQGACSSKACLWQRPTTQNFNYIFTHEGVPYTQGPINCSSTNQPAGYTLKSRGCAASGPRGCISDVCLWQKAGSPTASVNLILSHLGAPRGGNVNCSNSSPLSGYTFNSRVPILSTVDGRVYSDLCLWQKTNTCTTTAPLTASCSASPNPANTNQQVTFTPTVSGGTGSYTYSWSGACSGGSRTCSKTFTSAGSQTAFLRVTSGNETTNVQCQVQVNQTCTPNATQRCVGGSAYNFDSCGNQGSLIENCTANGKICSNGACIPVTCNTNSQCGTNGYVGDPFCQGGNVYQNYKTFTCNNPGTANSSCSDSTAPQLKTTCGNNQVCSNGACTTQNITCSTNSQCGTNGYVGDPFCQGGNVYQQFKTYTCNNPGTANSSCSDSTTTQLKTTCTSGQTCANGSCNTNNLTVTCSASPNPANTNQQVTFTPTVSGGTGNYTYQWSYGCNGTSSTCSTTFSSAGIYVATLSVTSGSQTQTTSCNVVVNQVVNPACSSNSQCGTNGYVGNSFCQDGNVYQNYKTYTCNNPGTANASCSDSTAPQLKTTCTSGQICSNGACTTQNITCSSNSQCGTNGYVGDPFCQGGNVYQNYKTFTCNNPGTANSSCSDSTAAQLKTTCSSGQICSGGSCNANNLTVSCSASPNPANVNQPVTFTSNVSGGTGSYTYQWSYGCTGTSSTCSNTFINGGTYAAVLSVTSGSQTQTTSCNVSVNQGQTCTDHAYQQCLGGHVHWFSSCGVDQGISQTCTGNQTCQGSTCVTNTPTCTNNAYQQCVGNSVYWYNSCGQQQGVVQVCSGNQTCQGNTCVTTTPTCTDHAYQQCLGGSVHWFSSCGVDQGISQACTGNQTCQGNVCVNQTQTSSVINVLVRNLSSGNLTWVKTVNAAPSDILQFSISVSAPGTQQVNSVTVTDVLPANLVYKDALTLDGVAVSGNITNGLNIGTLTLGQTKTITYQAQVAGPQSFNFGTTTLQDSATATSTDPNFIPGTSSATVLVIKSGVQGATDVPTGLTNNFFVDSFFLPLMLALLGFWVYKSGLITLPAWAGANKAARIERKAQKELEKRISQLRNQR